MEPELDQWDRARRNLSAASPDPHHAATVSSLLHSVVALTE